MEPNTPKRAQESGITRRELEAVIRRAAELYAADADADERISTEELLRIASELGLPERHVRQALLELPEAPAGQSLLDRICGPAITACNRVVRSDATPLFTRLEEYLTTREFLQVRRRQRRSAWYAPADDAISRLARGLSRPSRRHYLARARRVLLAVHNLDAHTAHVRIALDLSHRRRADALAGATVGGLVGAAAGTGLAILAGGAVGDVVGPPAAIAAGVLTFGGTTMTFLSVGLAAARARFRRYLAKARLEVDGLLDRVESGDRLEPPPAPWRRRLLTGLVRR